MRSAASCAPLLGVSRGCRAGWRRGRRTACAAPPTARRRACSSRARAAPARPGRRRRGRRPSPRSRARCRASGAGPARALQVAHDVADVGHGRGAVDARQIRLERRHAGGGDRRLVHGGGEVVAHHLAGRPARAPSGPPRPRAAGAAPPGCARGRSAARPRSRTRAGRGWRRASRRSRAGRSRRTRRCPDRRARCRSGAGVRSWGSPGRGGQWVAVCTLPVRCRKASPGSRLLVRLPGHVDGRGAGRAPRG